MRKDPWKDQSYLIERCLSGDARAQQHLYEKHKGKIMGLLRRYTSSRQEAQDIFQESFVIIFNKLSAMAHHTNLESWMKTIAVRTAINYYHKNKNQPSLFHEEEGEQWSDGSFEKTIEDIDLEQLLTLINTLPDGYRIVFNLYVVEGYSHAEISELLAISEGTSKSQLSRAKDMIKKHLMQLGITKYTKYA